MIQTSTAVTFSFTCPDPRAWLVLNGNHQDPRVVEMSPSAPSIWAATADLTPGEYLCRYYSGDDRQVSYFGPAQIDGGIDSGMDTRISIKQADISCFYNK